MKEPLNLIIDQLNLLNFNFPRDKEGNILCPILNIPPNQPRKDSNPNFIEGIIEEAKKLGFNILNNRYFYSCITTAASPHTPIKINEMPAHLLVWWWGENNTRIDFLALSKLPTNEKKEIIEIIAINTTIALKKILENIGEENFQNVEIYGLVGHSTPDARKQTGLSRGAQSAKDGHLNIVYHPYSQYQDMVKLKTITPEELLKHTGIIDTIIIKQWGNFLSNLARRIIQERGINITTELKHGSSQDQVSFYEGIKINCYKEPIPLTKALYIISEIVNVFNNIYEIIQQGYEHYWKNIHNPNSNSQELKHQIIQQIMQQINSQNLNDKKQIESIVDFAFSFKPTYGQICNFLQDSSLNDKSRKELERLKTKYEKRRKKLSEMTEKELDQLVKKISHYYDIDEIIAKSILTLIQHQIADPSMSWKNIEFTWPPQLSLAYAIENYDIKNDEIKVRKITIAFRFMSNKGVFEDMAGAIIKRNEAL